MDQTTIGFIGLGAMGFPICYGLHKSGYHMVLPLYRRASNEGRGFSALAPAAAAKSALFDEMLSQGAAGAESLAELVERSAVILLCLPTSDQVEAVVLGEGGVLERAGPGTLVIDMTSADPASTRRLHGLLGERGVGLLDAPVSGGTPKAVARTLTIMAGGDPEAFQQARPILETAGSAEHVYYMGPSGSGHTAKCINNFLSACNLLAATEALMVAAKSGIDPALAAEVIASSGGKSNAVMHTYPNLILPGNPFHFTIDLMRKDVHLFSRAARAAGVPSFLSGVADQLLGVAAGGGRGEEDCLELVRMLESWSGARLVGGGARG